MMETTQKTDKELETWHRNGRIPNRLIFQKEQASSASRCYTDTLRKSNAIKLKGKRHNKDIETSNYFFPASHRHTSNFFKRILDTFIW